jgi:hypothetical protein
MRKGERLLVIARRKGERLLVIARRQLPHVIRE